jgi:beta-lactamase class A
MLPLALVGGCDRPGAGGDHPAGGRPLQGTSPPAIREPQSPAEKELQAQLTAIGEAFEGEIGLAVHDIQGGWTAHFNGTKHFPQQSVSKLWVAITALTQVDRGRLDLDRQVTLTRDDLTVFYQPIRPMVLRPEGYATTLRDLLVRAITQSDNTANDYLLRQVGGPTAVRETLASLRIGGVRFGPGERELQSGIAGLAWRPEYSLGRNFYLARDQVPEATRRDAFVKYVAQPIDGAAPIGIVSALARLHAGELLSPRSTQLLLDTMQLTRSGAQRLKGGLPEGWTIAHKTGTGQEFAGSQAGYNDVGIVRSPAGRAYAVAVLMGLASGSLPERRALMQGVVQRIVQLEQHRTADEPSADIPGATGHS